MEKYIYCPQCGKKLSERSGNPFCSSCSLTYYQNSRPTVGVLVVKDGKVLLNRRGIDPHKGEIDVVGGFLNYGENPLDGAKREAMEETGLIVEPLEIVDIIIDEYGAGGLKTLNIFYLAKVLSGKEVAMDDAASLHWVDIDKVPTNVGFKSTQEALKKLKELYKIRLLTSEQQ